MLEVANSVDENAESYNQRSSNGREREYFRNALPEMKVMNIYVGQDEL